MIVFSHAWCQTQSAPMSHPTPRTRDARGPGRVDVLSDGAVQHWVPAKVRSPPKSSREKGPWSSVLNRMTTTYVSASYGMCTTRETSATPSRTKQVSEHPGEGSRGPPETSRWGRRSSFPQWRLIVLRHFRDTLQNRLMRHKSVCEDLLAPEDLAPGPSADTGLKRERPRSRCCGPGACALCSVSERVSASHPIQTRTARWAAQDICGGSRSGGRGDVLVALPSAPYASPNARRTIWKTPQPTQLQGTSSRPATGSAKRS